MSDNDQGAPASLATLPPEARAMHDALADVLRWLHTVDA